MSVSSRAADRPRRRTGLGMVLGLVIWVVAIALVYALLSSQARSGALAGVARVSYLRSLAFAGQSALDEASFALRFHPGGVHPVLKQIENGSSSGAVLEPALTRESFRAVVPDGRIAIDPVTYSVANRGDDSSSWLIELATTVQVNVGGGLTSQLRRTIRRRHTAYVRKVVETVGPAGSVGKVVYQELSLVREPLFEVIAP